LSDGWRFTRSLSFGQPHQSRFRMCNSAFSEKPIGNRIVGKRSSIGSGDAAAPVRAIPIQVPERESGDTAHL